jgi:cytochrome P450
MKLSQQAHAYPFSEGDGLRVHPRYAQLRTDDPVIRVKLAFGEEAWLVSRYEDAKTVLGDPRFSRAAAVGRDEPRNRPRLTDQGLLMKDPPDHTRLRRVVARAFTQRRVEQLRVSTTQIAERLLDQIEAAGPPADLVAGFGTPLPVTVICELLGVPEQDRENFHTWSEAIVSTTGLSLDVVYEYIANMQRYMTELIAQRRVEPADDLISDMIKVRDEEEDRLSEEELVHLAWGLVAAGHETTASQLPNFVYVLLTNPQRLTELREHPELMPTAVEELMRYVPLGVGANFARYATEDIKLSGVLVRAGEPVLVPVHSANRDGTVFPHPDEVDFHREVTSHLGFGHGAHHCLGAQLARMELQVALGSLITRLPGLRLAVPEEELPWKTGRLVRALAELPVAW